jgi:hypothetical protein
MSLKKRQQHRPGRKSLQEKNKLLQRKKNAGKPPYNSPGGTNKIVNEFVMHYRMQGLRPVSVNTIILAALDVLKQTPQIDEVVHAIVAADKRVTRLN